MLAVFKSLLLIRSVKVILLKFNLLKLPVLWVWAVNIIKFLNISGMNIDQNFIIIEQLHHPLILGLDFMQQHNVSIDFDRRIMTFHDNLVAVALKCDSKFGYPRSLKRKVIPADSEVTIPVKLSKCFKQDVVCKSL